MGIRLGMHCVRGKAAEDFSSHFSEPGSSRFRVFVQDVAKS